MHQTAMRNLTLASAKHLLQQGHISPTQHRKIVRKAKTAPSPMADETAFGSLHPVMGAGAGHYMSDVPEDQ